MVFYVFAEVTWQFFSWQCFDGLSIVIFGLVYYVLFLIFMITLVTYLRILFYTKSERISNLDEQDRGRFFSQLRGIFQLA